MTSEPTKRKKIGLTNHIKVTVIRNAAGMSLGSKASRSQPPALLFTPNTQISYKLPSGKGSNQQDLYDPAKPSKVINIMGFMGAPSKDFVAFRGNNLEDQIPLSTEMKSKEELVIVWKPLLGLDRPDIPRGVTRDLLIRGLSRVVIPDKIQPRKRD